MSACTSAPLEKTIPYLIQPEEIVPGERLAYASTCGGCPAGCGILAQAIDGRPVKLEGNPDHPVSRGALCGIGQATVLELYDSHRLRTPFKNRQPVDWTQIDLEITTALEEIRQRSGKVYFVSGTIVSPTQRREIETFLSTFEGARWVRYDNPSYACILDAYEKTFGTRICPHYQFDKADVVVGFNADFLGTWISPVEFAQGYRDGRSLEGSRLRFSHHTQFESRMTLTGARADERVCLSPVQYFPTLHALARLLAEMAQTAVPLEDREVNLDFDIKALARRLWNTRGKSLVVCGVQDTSCQMLTSLINELLGNHRRTVDLSFPSFQISGDDSLVAEFARDLEKEKIDAILFSGVDPAYDLKTDFSVEEALRRIPCSISFSDRWDATSATVQFICPVPHYLECWGDSAPTARVLSLQQPVIPRLGNTRNLIESLSVWQQEPRKDLEIVKSYWRDEIYPMQVGFRPFEEFWEKALQDGLAPIRGERVTVQPFNYDSLLTALPSSLNSGDLYLELFPSVCVRDGSHSNNPWLQELPDPITKISWGNPLMISPKLADRMDLATGDLVRISAQNVKSSLDIPVVVVPGQHQDVVAIAIGYGRRETGRFAGIGPDWIGVEKPEGELPIGQSVTDFQRSPSERFQLIRDSVQIRKLGGTQLLATAQQAYPAETLRSGSEALSPIREMAFEALLSKRPQAEAAEAVELWPEDHRYPGHHWAMAIDLGACTGCSACVIACQAENNIPVVGPDEIRRKRAMHWIRIDRYVSDNGAMANVGFQPMLCQHCDHAPCESVCPVLATVHSEEGVNQQIYNRCVGTRYCSNNCPYKVRVFNWFDYSTETRLENLQLNPDVSIRSRGVMEKCSLCFQRILKARIAARREKREIGAEELQTACQQTCPSRAIIFGDRNDPDSAVSALLQSPRGYRLLEELNTEPGITYLSAVRNRSLEEGD